VRLQLFAIAGALLVAGQLGEADYEAASVTAAIEEEVRLEAASAAGAALAALYREGCPDQWIRQKTFEAEFWKVRCVTADLQVGRARR